MNLRTLILYWPTSLILSLAVAHAGPAPSGAQRNKAAAEQTTQELRKLTDDLKRLEPIIARLEKMRGIMAITRETSPTLEKLDKLMIKADLVERVNLLLERAEKIEPILRSLEEMQRDFAERRREKGGIASAPVEKWSDIFDRLQNRLDAVEKRLYAPPALDDPAARQNPVELRIKALEDRQRSLVKEMEALRKENERLRRQQRQEGL